MTARTTAEDFSRAQREHITRLAALPPQAVQETKALLNQHLRANAVRALGLGLAAEYQSHEQPEYREAGERLRTRDR